MKTRFETLSAVPDLRIGALSDIHLCHDREGFLEKPASRSQERFIKALEYFRDRHVDAVLVAGDLTNSGLLPELELAAEDVKKGVFSDAARRAKAAPPEFDADAKVVVEERRGTTRNGRECDQLVVTFPTVTSKDGRPRAYEYRVRALAADGMTLAETKVYSPFIHCAESHEPATSICVFEKTPALAGKCARFTVEPLDCWGNAGRAVGRRWYL